MLAMLLWVLSPQTAALIHTRTPLLGQDVELETTSTRVGGNRLWAIKCHYKRNTSHCSHYHSHSPVYVDVAMSRHQYSVMYSAKFSKITIHDNALDSRLSTDFFWFPVFPSYAPCALGSNRWGAKSGKIAIYARNIDSNPCSTVKFHLFTVFGFSKKN